jgi:hypothetical protein
MQTVAGSRLAHEAELISKISQHQLIERRILRYLRAQGSGGKPVRRPVELNDCLDLGLRYAKQCGSPISASGPARLISALRPTLMVLTSDTRPQSGK